MTHFISFILELGLSHTGFDGLLVLDYFFSPLSWLGGEALAFFNFTAIFQLLSHSLLLEGCHWLLVLI